MQKLQILFPELVLTELREIAAYSDRPVSELVRRAVDDFLLKHPRPDQLATSPKIPTFKGGKMKVSSQELKDLVYEYRTSL